MSCCDKRRSFANGTAAESGSHGGIARLFVAATIWRARGTTSR